MGYFFESDVWSNSARKPFSVILSNSRSSRQIRLSWQHSIVLYQHWRGGGLQISQSQHCLRRTERPGLGALGPEAWNQTESLQGSCYSIPALCKETWTVYSRHAEQLKAFHIRCLRTLLRIRWQDKVPDTEVLQRAESESIHAILLRSQLRWAGHVQRMDDSWLPKRLLCGELKAGQCSLGRPKKRYKDKESLKRCDIPYSTWEVSANDRPAWHSLVSTGVLAFEAKRIHEKIRFAREERKGVQIPKLVQPPASPARIATDTFARRLGSSAIFAPTLLHSDMKSWSSSPAKDEHHHHHQFHNLMAFLAQNVGENPRHVPWNNKNTEFEWGRQNMMGYLCMNFKAVYECTPYLHDREKYYYCTRHSGASPTKKSASQLKK